MFAGVPTSLPLRVAIQVQFCVSGHAGWFLNYSQLPSKGLPMNSIVYIVGLVVIVIAVMSFFGLR
jgi:hypothetical protein